ncbi:MAG TPA: c-type cytochrome biogenesis protein CcmI, partial [Ramlibacter sp.]|nr:c-type cytochrome biogenesis protein CcmI [Ramlibacter sp.]
MTGFVIAAGVIVALVLVLLLRPFLRSIGPRPTSHQDLNSAIYREQLAKLEQDLAEGTLGKDDYAQARAELQRRLLDESRGEEVTVKLNPPRKTMIGIALAVPLVAAAFYLMIGNPASMTAGAAHQQMASNEDLDRMVAGLAQKLEKEPENYKGWAMLARSYKAMGRTAEAEKAFERAGSFIDDDAQMLASYADVVATNNGGSLAGKPAMLIQKALKADPDHPMSLWLSGTADLEVKNYTKALRTFERLAALLPPGSDDARMLQGAIDDVRAKAGLSAAAAAPAPAPALAVAAGGKVSGTVELDPSLKGKAGPDDTVMVIARLPGSRMPLAAVRLRAAQLPVQFTLDDSLSMNPKSPISA